MVKNLRSNLISNKVSASQRKFNNASAHKSWRTGEAIGPQVENLRLLGSPFRQAFSFASEKRYFLLSPFLLAVLEKTVGIQTNHNSSHALKVHLSFLTLCMSITLSWTKPVKPDFTDALVRCAR